MTISIDSRTIKKGELFIAIKGKNFDGHDFIEDAVKKGASGVVSNRSLPRVKKVPVIVTKDTVTALGDMAADHRRKFNIPVVGITGSNGKTTAKEIIASLLGAKFNVLKNKGTENNFIGLPLTLLKLKARHTAAVLEMGANHLGEIGRLSRILKPTIGLITNIGPSHLEYFGDLSSVFKAKSEMIEFLRGYPLILNGDDIFLKRLKKKTKAVTFGIDKINDFRATDITQKGSAVEFKLNEKICIKMSLAGRHNVYNALAGIAVASILGIGSRAIKNRLAAFKPLPMRMRKYSFNGLYIIDDTYNSNPLSSKYAVEFLSEFRTKGKKIFVTGDMLELGKRAPYFHRRLGRLAAASPIDKLITVGKLSRETGLSAKKSGMKNNSIWMCPSIDKVAAVLDGLVEPGDVILVKGSRAMHMEKIIENL